MPHMQLIVVSPIAIKKKKTMNLIATGKIYTVMYVQ